MSYQFKVISLITASIVLLACSKDNNEVSQVDSPSANTTTTDTLLPEVAVADRIVPATHGTLNEEAPIPSQCYTKTESVHNPCYTCHQSYSKDTEYRGNQRNDGDNQGEYTFSEEGETNSWSNLFLDRTDWIAQISDEDIMAYIDQDNYSDLAQSLENTNWQGFIPDLENYHLAEKAFDEKGLAKDGSNWVAFNYKPFPGTFWPTNGATDDVLIRLPNAFREVNGKFDEAVYFANLSVIEMAIKGLSSIDIFSLDESQLEIDVNNDGRYDTSVEVMTVPTHYLGDAANIAVIPQQYPQGTEIMHSVRYVGVDEQGNTTVPARMKELRYMKKTKVMSEADLDTQYRRERKEKLDEQLPHFTRIQDKGFNNKHGWLIQGFIEDYDGALRPQSYEEDFFCMGCHSAIGTTIDQTFAFPRKITGTQGWGYIDLKGMKDAPSKGQPEGEILQYLKLNGGGNEFRENPEMFEKWYLADGTLN